MPTVRVKVSVYVDGLPVPGFPLARRIESPTEAQAFVGATIPTGGATTAILGSTTIPTHKAVAIQPDQTITLRRLNEVVGNAPLLTQGGLYLVCDGAMAGNFDGVNNGSAGAKLTIVDVG